MKIISRRWMAVIPADNTSVIMREREGSDKMDLYVCGPSVPGGEMLLVTYMDEDYASRAFDRYLDALKASEPFFRFPSIYDLDMEEYGYLEESDAFDEILGVDIDSCEHEWGI